MLGVSKQGDDGNFAPMLLNFCRRKFNSRYMLAALMLLIVAAALLNSLLIRSSWKGFGHTNNGEYWGNGKGSFRDEKDEGTQAMGHCDKGFDGR